MKRISNLLKDSLMVVAGILAIGAAMPVVVSGTASAVTAPFCSNLSATTDKVNAAITSMTTKLTQARTTEDEKRAADRAKVDQQLAANWAKWDAQRDDNFSKLEAKATTDPQKAAVTTYEATVRTAIKTRRDANTQARTAFRNGVDAAVSSRRGTVDTQVETLKN
jgi:hypothetical protein